jgi:hypothetical protein
MNSWLSLACYVIQIVKCCGFSNNYFTNKKMCFILQLRIWTTRSEFCEDTFTIYKDETIVISNGVTIQNSYVYCFVDRFFPFMLWFFFFWPLCCLSFFALRIPIIPLVSSNSSSNSVVFIQITIE